MGQLIIFINSHYFVVSQSIRLIQMDRLHLGAQNHLWYQTWRYSYTKIPFGTRIWMGDGDIFLFKKNICLSWKNILLKNLLWPKFALLIKLLINQCTPIANLQAFQSYKLKFWFTPKYLIKIKIYNTQKHI